MAGYEVGGFGGGGGGGGGSGGVDLDDEGADGFGWAARDTGDGWF